MSTNTSLSRFAVLRDDGEVLQLGVSAAEAQAYSREYNLLSRDLGALRSCRVVPCKVWVEGQEAPASAPFFVEG